MYWRAAGRGGQTVVARCRASYVSNSGVTINPTLKENPIFHAKKKGKKTKKEGKRLHIRSELHRLQQLVSVILKTQERFRMHPLDMV